ncbi:flagellar hook-length control protein FliK [Bordetella holmesii]|uniref:flagellar hook-length control protein FliK n=1 Tax=Bordetella holmesii TaxID=35814 RepID=UPI0004523D4D|nr:flagellar hook-length control protein FliK [Bordetella holmesii]EWM44811.1 flagellar hook-length control FliK family protein [Bordetella holmesii 70147]QGD45048.1 flagellar hook-length control protein FliK [Bordetella holmesii]
MSIGPPALGNVLVQRLDAVLGTTMAAHANTLTGARPDAVGQPGQAARTSQTDDATRDPRGQIDGAGGKADRQAAAVDAKTAAALALAARGLVTRNDTTASAPTTLGNTARIILSLLAQYPNAAPAVQSASALWTPPQAAENAAGGAAREPSVSAPRISQPETDQPRESGAKPAPAASGVQGPPASSQPAAALFAQALKASLQTSGLFYESHLTEMVYGQRTPQTLRDEPQANLPAAPAYSAPAASPAPAHTAQASASAVLTLSAEADTARAQDPGAPIGGLHSQTNTLVRQQLEILANNAVYWSSRLVLHLPRLGEIDVRLSLAGSQLVLQLTAPQSATELKHEAKTLRQQLSGAGLTLSDLSVQAVDPERFQTTDFLLSDA